MKILVVEDDPDVAHLVRSALERASFVTDWADSLAVAQTALQDNTYDLLILDRRLGSEEGATLIPLVRRISPSLPVLVLSALGSSSDKVEGLNLGADDYLAKPFENDELLARIRALLRRPQTIVTEALSAGNLMLDVTLGQAAVDEVSLDLPRRELLLLESLMRRAGRTVRRSLIESEVYGFDDDYSPSALDPHVSRLRKRLADSGATVDLHTVRGVGYILSTRT